MEKVCVHCLIEGKVQGVWYRASTQKKATTLGLTGWVRNLDDGRVEAMLMGDKVAVHKMIDWLWRGPLLAKVNNVIVEPTPCEQLDSFEVR